MIYQRRRTSPSIGSLTPPSTALSGLLRSSSGRETVRSDQTGRQLGTVAGPVVGSVTLLLKEWISPVVRLDRSP